MVIPAVQAEAAMAVAAHLNVQTAIHPGAVHRDKVLQEEARRVVIHPVINHLAVRHPVDSHLVNKHPAVVRPDAILPAVLHPKEPDQRKILRVEKAPVKPEAVPPVNYYRVVPF